MKSLKIALAVVLSAMMLVSCGGNKGKEKKYLDRTGIKKIAAIYYRGDDGRDILYNRYVWEGENLARVEMMWDGEVYGTTTFTYENGKPVKSVTHYEDELYEEYFGCSSTAVWNGDQIATITDDQYGTQYRYIYGENGKVSKLEVYAKISKDALMKRAELRKERNMPANMMEERMLKEMANAPKEYDETPYRSWVYTYEGENVVKSDYYFNNEYVESNELTFDEGINPTYALWLDSYFTYSSLSRNNMISYYVAGDPTDEYYHYTYTYDEDNHVVTYADSYGMTYVWEYVK